MTSKRSSSRLNSSSPISVDTNDLGLATPGTASPVDSYTEVEMQQLQDGALTPPTTTGRSTTPISLPSTTTSATTTTTTTTTTTDTTTTGATKLHAEGRWTKQEDGKLRAAVAEMGGKNWKKISEMAFNGVRSDVQCLHRWQKVLRPGLHKGPWSKEEDAIVLEYVRTSGGVHAVKWSAVAHQVKGRLGKQVRERWYNHLDPLLKKGPWSAEEDALLLQLQASMGNRWCEIAKNIAGRSENAVKNRWNSAQRRARAQKENKGKDKDGGGGGTTTKKTRKMKKAQQAATSSAAAAGKTTRKRKASAAETTKKSKSKRPTKKMKQAAEAVAAAVAIAAAAAKASSTTPGSSSPGGGLSVIADIGTALQMCEMVAAASSSPVQSPTRPATPPTRKNKNETAAHVLAQSFVRISKEETAASALLAIF